MIVSISRDGKHVCDLHIDDHHNWAEVCNAIRDRMFPDVKMDTSRPPEPKMVKSYYWTRPAPEDPAPKPEPKRRGRRRA